MSYQFGTNWAVFSDKRGSDHRAAHGLRSAHRVLPRSRFPRRHVVRHAEGRQAPAFLRHAHGGRRHFHLRVLDPERQQLDADADGLRHQSRRAVRAGRGLAADHLQSEFSLPPRAHRHRGVSDYRAGRRRGGRVAPAARIRQQAHARKMFSMAMWMAALVAPVQIFVGDLHGLNTLEHQPAESHGDGRALPEPSRTARRSSCSAFRTTKNSAWTTPSRSRGCRR